MSAIAIQLKPARRAGLRAQRASLFLLLLMCGLAVFVLACNYYELLPTNGSLAYEGVLSAGLLIVAVLLKKAERLARYWPIAYAFFVASTVWFVQTLVGGTGNWLVRLFGVPVSTPMGTAVYKVGEAAGTVAIILALVKGAGMDLDSMFIKRGNLKWALVIGSTVVLNFGTAALMASIDQYPDPSLLGPVLLWGLVFALSNGFMEELWFRGLFLRRLQPLIGTGAAIVLSALLFAIMHAGALYMSPAAMPVFLINLLTHGLAMGYLVFKMDNLWGAALYHAACDLWLFIAWNGAL